MPPPKFILERSIKNVKVQVNLGGRKWKTKQFCARTVTVNSLLQKASKLFTKKKDLRTNHKDVPNVGKLENNKETAVEIFQITTDGKLRGELNSPFYFKY